MPSTKYKLYNNDCLEVMPRLRDNSIDMVMVDPPYGTTACKWDSIIPLEPMWKALKKIVKPNGAILIMGSQPFSSVLACSNLKQFRYEWIWDKGRPSGCATAKKIPMKVHEIVSVFYEKAPTYIPDMVLKERPQRGKNVTKPGRSQPALGGEYKTYTHSYPISIIYERKGGPTTYVHPTQKPVALMEYLIKTYTKEGDTVLDFAMGSGTTGVACANVGKRFIGIENDTEHGYFEIAEQRVKEAYCITRKRRSRDDK